MRNDCVLTDDEFGSDVAEGRAFAKRNVVFNDRGLSLVLHDYQIAGMRHYRLIACGRNEQEINGLTYDNASANVHISAVLGKGSVQRAKCIPMNIEVAAEMRFKLA